MRMHGPPWLRTGGRFWRSTRRCGVPKTSAGSLPPYTLTPVDGQVTRMVAVLAPGAVVTTTRAHAQAVATKDGTAILLGCSLAEHARSLIAMAAPQFREQLERAACELHVFA